MDLPQLGPVVVLFLKSRKSAACPEPPPLPYTATENALIKLILSSAFHLHRQAKYATLQHLESCEVATYRYSKVSFLKLQCWLHGNKG